MILNHDQFTLKIAQTEAELSAAQRLRYRVFVEEMGARPVHEPNGAGHEADAFDPFFDHLILTDESIADDRENVVGVYRLMQGETAVAGPGFYGASEYDLSKITNSGRRVLELGRSCVDARYRGSLALHLLWQGVADYVKKNDIELLFGVASFAGTSPQDYADGLAFLHHNHLAPEALRVAARQDNAVSMAVKTLEEIDRLKAVRQIPTLIKSYLRLGGFVGQDAYLDHDFNVIDVCVILDRNLIPAKQRLQLEQGLTA
ncbi:MAG: GNAT family N-acyltransferase [Amylibacter sp.]